MAMRLTGWFVVLALATCGWVRDHHNVFVVGPTGIGKSFLACAFAERACRSGYSAYYVRAPRLLHDLAVARRAAGRRIGPALVREALGQARQQQLRFSALVSVQDSHAFWNRMGYAEHQPDPEHAAHLHSYQVPATYMVRPLQ